MNKSLIIILLSLRLCVHGQAPVLWDSLCGVPSNSIDCLLGVDTINSLFATGDFTNIGAINSWGIAKWNGGWDSIPGGIGNIQFSNMPNSMQLHSDMIWYKNKLYIGDVESWHDYVKTGPLGIWNGSQWDTLPGQPFLNRLPDSNYDRAIMSFKNIEDTLYIGGVFDSVGNQAIQCIVKFDGVNFHTLHFQRLSTSNRINAIEKYKGEIYAGGNMTDNSSNPNPTFLRIYRYNGSTWYSVGNGIPGGFSKVNCMAVYKGYLYVAGWFTQGDGNAGNYIMKWDGNNWFPIPGGIEGTDGEVKKILVHNDKLYVFGSFDHAGDIPASRMAVYDGKQWCDLGGLTYGYVKAATFYKDTLYVGGTFGYIGDRYIWYVAKRLAGDYHDTCGVYIDTDTLAVKEIANEFKFKIYPNPASSILNIVDENNQLQNSTIEIKNYLGQTVFTSPFNSQINLSDLSAGMYFLTLRDKEKKRTVKIVKE